MAAPTHVSVTIPAGQAVSSSVDLTSKAMVTLMVPATWTPANISFLASYDDVNFYDLFDPAGVEVLKPVGPGRAVIIDPEMTQAALYVKIRSGPRAGPVIQQSDCVLNLVLM